MLLLLRLLSLSALLLFCCHSIALFILCIIIISHLRRNERSLCDDVLYQKAGEKRKKMKAAGSPCDFRSTRPELLQLKCSLINVSFCFQTLQSGSPLHAPVQDSFPSPSSSPPHPLVSSSSVPPLFRPTTAKREEHHHMMLLIPVPIRVELLQLKSHSTAALGSNELKGFPLVSLRKWIICHLRFSLLLKVQSVHACHP